VSQPGELLDEVLFAYALERREPGNLGIGHPHLSRPAAAGGATLTFPSGRLFDQLAVFPEDERQAELAVLGSNIARGAAQRAFGARHKRRGGRSFSGFCVVGVFAHSAINCRTVLISCVAENASRFASNPRLSQMAQRVASGR